MSKPKRKTSPQQKQQQQQQPPPPQPPPKDKKPVILEQYANFKLRVAPSKIHRWGVYAGQAIPPNRKVIEYTGELISRRETKRRSDSSDMIYLFTVDNYWTKDGSVGGSGAEYINHCCEPNLRTLILKRHILYVSARLIKPGEELTVDYRFDKSCETVPCSCGAKNCRGTINLKE